MPAGLFDGLASDLDAFDGKRAEVPVAREDLRAATRTQDAAAKTAVEFLAAVRTAIVRTGANEAQRAAFGLKLRVNPNKVTGVVAALDAFVDGATKWPEAARAAGVVSSELDTARTLRAALVAADVAQETKKETRKNPTAERNAAHVRIERAVDTLVAVSGIAFLTQPPVAARFRGLVPTSGKKPAAPSAPN